jgi:hypothetical protein
MCMAMHGWEGSNLTITSRCSPGFERLFMT